MKVEHYKVVLSAADIRPLNPNIPGAVTSVPIHRLQEEWEPHSVWKTFKKKERDRLPRESVD